VGTSFIVPTDHAEHPWLAHTPTMRVPRDIRGTDNVYVAMLAMLQAVARHNRSDAPAIRTVACPGLGTATGRVPAWEAARQMRVAWNAATDPITQITWPNAKVRHHAVAWRGEPQRKW
jgi:O-acetyl-ADP-ribose deacetylase (regulator of RNase III)